MHDSWGSVAENIRRYLHAFTARTVFDVGAHVGGSSQLLLEAFPDATIFAFEPISDSYQKLVRLALREPRVKPYRMALSSVRGAAAMSDSSDPTLARVVHLGPAQPDQVDVDAINGDLFCGARQIEQIDYLRIDAEGHELHVLRGFSRLLDRQGIRLIELVIGLGADEPVHVSLDAVRRLIEPRGYALFWLFDQTMDFHFSGTPKLRRARAIFLSKRIIEENSFGNSLFICGCGHTGTTLLATMFAANANAYVPLLETEMFLKPEIGLERYRDLRDAAAAAGKHHLVEKTPRHIRHLDRLRAAAPGARIIAMVRDGRDVAASFIKRHGKASVGTERWLLDTGFVATERGSPDVFVQRYEDLVRDPDGCLQRICAFAGIPYDPAMLHFHQQQRLWFGQTELRRGDGREGEEHRALRSWQINQPIYDDSGKWRTMLTEEDVAPFRQGEGRALLKMFGYDPDIALAEPISS